MLKLSGIAAYDQVVSNIRRKIVHIPAKSDPVHYRDGGIFPPLAPRFRLAPGQTVFTIGSCFARNIEEALASHDLHVPVAKFEIPRAELPHSAPHLLNEYNAGTILQRIESSVGSFTYRPEMGVEDTKGGLIDLFLHIHSAPVDAARLKERRATIDALYKSLPHSDVVVITLGLVESWFDSQYDCYLNRAPSRALLKREPGRFEFHRLDHEDVVGRMRRAISIMKDTGTPNVLLTVSPIPIEATFMPDGAVVANSYSKAVLRTSVETLVREFDFVDYFPSYEIATSFGSSAYIEDNVHISDGVVRKIINYMVDNFMRRADDDAGTLRSVADYQTALLKALGDQNLPIADEIAAIMLNVHPDSWQTYDAIGHLRSAQGRHDMALASAVRAMELGGRHWEYLARIGCIYEDMGRYDEAEAVLAEATALPRSSLAAQWLQRVRDKRAAARAHADATACGTS